MDTSFFHLIEEIIGLISHKHYHLESTLFKEIIFVGTTVYVATDAGIITSDGGKNWEVFTNTEGKNLIMEHLAADGTILYGVTKDTGIYRLKGSTWKQIISETPDSCHFPCC